MTDPRSGPRRRTASLKITALFAALMMALLALNSPLTFASASTATPAVTRSVNQTTTTTAPSPSVAAVAKQANPAIVTVINLQAAQDPSAGQTSTTPQAVGSGSGYIIDAAGHVVTNNHVVEGGAAFQVEFADKTMVDATLVGADPYQDVAVLKLTLKSGQKVPGTVAFGDSSTVQTGDPVIAIGTPFGEYQNSVTIGIVNGVDRSLDEGNGFRLPNLFQHDAAIYPGNSGGPLLNLNGEVIGMNVAKAVDPTQGSRQATTSIGFAIEGNAVKSVVGQILKTGSVARAYLGIRTQPTAAGQGVVSVDAGTPAAKAGLQSGDVITAIDGKTIDSQNPFGDQLVFDHKPGDKIELTIQRNGAEKTISVTLGARPAASQ
ncbi:MAG: S1C family serine protease [Thermomicrobiales bacterium]